MSLKIDLRNIEFNFHDNKGFDQSYLTRYMMVCEIVKQAYQQLGSRKRLKVLDLGGYNGLARQLLPGYDVTILDTFKDDELEDYIQVSKPGIPCDDNSFDIVISTDVLEHIKLSGRDLFVSDAIRVAKHLVVIAAPFGDKDVVQEEFLSNQLYVGQTKKEYSWLKEHHEYGLPKKVWMDKLLENHRADFTTFSHTTTRLWGQLTMSGFFTADNIYQANKILGSKLRRLNEEYFKEYAGLDFPESGYRTYYLIGKGGKPEVKLPTYDADRIEFFMGKVQRVLGQVVARMSKDYAELAESRRKQDDLIKQAISNEDEIRRLKAIEVAYLDVMKSKRYRVTEPIVKLKNAVRRKRR